VHDEAAIVATCLAALGGDRHDKPGGLFAAWPKERLASDEDTA
jgi:hypothetical protein